VREEEALVFLTRRCDYDDDYGRNDPRRRRLGCRRPTLDPGPTDDEDGEDTALCCRREERRKKEEVIVQKTEQRAKKERRKEAVLQGLS